MHQFNLHVYKMKYQLSENKIYAILFTQTNC
jgi:hypothetical protein